MPDVCLSFVLLFTIFIIVVTQKLVLQQSINVTAKCTENLSPPPCILYLLGVWCILSQTEPIFYSSILHTLERGIYARMVYIMINKIENKYKSKTKGIEILSPGPEHNEMRCF